jgi:hypothetical protein
MDQPIRPKEGGFFFTAVPLPSTTNSHSPREKDDDPEHEYEIKEQDRWLPLANGKYCPSQGDGRFIKYVLTKLLNSG